MAPCVDTNQHQGRWLALYAMRPEGSPEPLPVKRQAASLVRYKGGIIRRNGLAWRAEYCHEGERFRKQKPTLAEAKTWIEEKALEILSAEEPLTMGQVAEYRAAIAKLPERVSLLDAVSGYLAQLHSAPLSDKPITEAVDRFMEDKKAAGLRDRTLYTLKWSIGRLVAALGDRPVSEIRTGDLLDLLTDLKPVTRDNHRRAWRSFFRWAGAAGYCTTNPAQAISRTRVDEKVPEIFTVDQVEALLKAALKEDGGSMVPYLVIGLFAGLRTYGLLRLHWEQVNSVIHVTPEVEKLRTSRYIEIRPNLAAWLKDRRGKGRVCPYAQKHAFEVLRDIRKAAGVPWPRNAMRHSFGSYLLAEIQDAGKVAHEMGHHSPDMLYRHYRALVAKEDAARYWAITPGSIGHKLDNSSFNGLHKPTKTSKRKTRKIKVET